jgi:hypothetical protein
MQFLVIAWYDVTAKSTRNRFYRVTSYINRVLSTLAYGSRVPVREKGRPAFEAYLLHRPVYVQWYQDRLISSRTISRRAIWLQSITGLLDTITLLDTS